MALSFCTGDGESSHSFNSDLAAQLNKPDNEIVDHYTYVILGDGCQMEGVVHEVLFTYWTLGLGKLVALYDDNHISTDVGIGIAFTEYVDLRFKASGWHAIWVKNGNSGLMRISSSSSAGEGAGGVGYRTLACTVTPEFTRKKWSSISVYRTTYRSIYPLVSKTSKLF